MRVLLLFFCLACLIVSLGFLSVYNARRHEVDAEAFLSLVGKNQPLEAFQTATPGFQRNFAWERFHRFVDQFQLTEYRAGTLKVDSAYTNYTQRAGLTALLRGTAELRDGTRFNATIRLRKIGEPWKMDYLYVHFPKLPTAKTPTPGSQPAPPGTDAALNSKPLAQPTVVPRRGPLTAQPSVPETARPDVAPSPNPLPSAAPLVPVPSSG